METVVFFHACLSQRDWTQQVLLEETNSQAAWEPSSLVSDRRSWCAINPCKKSVINTAWTTQQKLIALQGGNGNSYSTFRVILISKPAAIRIVCFTVEGDHLHLGVQTDIGTHLSRGGKRWALVVHNHYWRRSSQPETECMHIIEHTLCPSPLPQIQPATEWQLTDCQLTNHRHTLSCSSLA